MKRTDSESGRATPAVLIAAAVLAAGGAAAAAQAPALDLWDVARLRSVTSLAFDPAAGRIAYLLSVPRHPLDDESGAAWRELHVVDAAGASRPFVTGEVTLSEIRWVPGGDAVSFLAQREADEHKALYAIPAAGGESRRVCALGDDVADYAWSPDGRRVALLAREAESEELQTLAEQGFDQEVVDEDWRPVHVWIADAATCAEPRRLDLDGSASAIHWSPVGDRLAVVTAPTALVDDRYMARGIQVVAAADGAPVASHGLPGKMGQVAFSPDGARLAWIAAADYNDPREGRLVVAPASGGEARDLLPGLAGHVTDFAWRDGETLVFVAAEGVGTRLGSVPLEGGAGTLLGAAGQPIWRQLAVAGDRVALRGDAPGHPAEVWSWSIAESAPARLTEVNPWLAERTLAPQRVVSFKARDGLELEGLLVEPPGARPEMGYPLILMVHGGPEAHESNGWLTTYSRPAQVLAGRGYAVFYINYRGSTGRGVAFSKLSQADPAGAEFDDLVDGVDHLIAEGLVDRDRVGITGASYGGYATAWAATRLSERFAAGVMFVGVSDHVTKLGTSDIPRELYAVHARHWPWEDWQRMLDRSPLVWVEQARTPLLILGGKKDSRVFPGQSLALYRYLKLLNNVPVRLVFYPGEAHGNRKAAARFDYGLRLVRWFDHYLSGPGGEPPPHQLDYHAAIPGAAPEPAP